MVTLHSAQQSGRRDRLKLLPAGKCLWTFWSLLESTEPGELTVDFDLTVSKHEQLQGGSGWCMKGTGRRTRLMPPV